MLTELKTTTVSPKSYYDICTNNPYHLTTQHTSINRSLKDMAVFDHLRYLTQYLYDAHLAKKHHLSDLYEHVQYHPMLVTRMYLMITVGAVYMRVAKEGHKDTTTQVDEFPHDIQSGSNEADLNITIDFTKPKIEKDSPAVKDLMKDMLEMSRGVQNPIRGLFLRYYLSAVTRDYLPDHNSNDSDLDKYYINEGCLILKVEVLTIL